MMSKISNKQKRRILIAFILAPIIFLFSTITTSNITHRYDIIPSLNKVSALECTGSGISQLFCDTDMLDLGSFEFFNTKTIAKNYTVGKDPLVVILLDLLSCLFVLSIIFAFIISFKIMVQEMAPWGEESAEKFKRAKSKFLEIGKAFIIPVVIIVVIIIISSIFGVKPPLGLSLLSGISSSVGSNINKSIPNKYNDCVSKNEYNALQCVESVTRECYNELSKIQTGTSEWTNAVGVCVNGGSIVSCIRNCEVGFRKGTSDYNTCVNNCN